MLPWELLLSRHRGSWPRDDRGRCPCVGAIGIVPGRSLRESAASGDSGRRTWPAPGGAKRPRSPGETRHGHWSRASTRGQGRTLCGVVEGRIKGSLGFEFKWQGGTVDTVAKGGVP